MKPEFNYESVPFDFSHCFCGQCKVADKCLRYQLELSKGDCGQKTGILLFRAKHVLPDSS